MQFLAVIFFGICAGFAVTKAFDVHRWRETRRFWICAAIAVPLTAATAAMTWSFFVNPILDSVQTGFAPERTIVISFASRSSLHP